MLRMLIDHFPSGVNTDRAPAPLRTRCFGPEADTPLPRNHPLTLCRRIHHLRTVSSCQQDVNGQESLNYWDHGHVSNMWVKWPFCWVKKMAGAVQKTSIFHRLARWFDSTRPWRRDKMLDLVGKGTAKGPPKSPKNEKGGSWSHGGSPSHHGCFNTRIQSSDLDDLEYPHVGKPSYGAGIFLQVDSAVSPNDDVSLARWDLAAGWCYKKGCDGDTWRFWFLPSPPKDMLLRRPKRKMWKSSMRSWCRWAPFLHGPKKFQVCYLQYPPTVLSCAAKIVPHNACPRLWHIWLWSWHFTVQPDHLELCTLELLKFWTIDVVRGPNCGLHWQSWTTHCDRTSQWLERDAEAFWTATQQL